MVPKKHFIKAAWALLWLCTLVGVGGAVACAGEDPGMQLVLVLDAANGPGNAPAKGILSQAANLLVHLLQEEDYLGLVAAGEPESVILPLGSLTQELRVQALARLARLTEGPSQKPPLEFLPQALGVFQPEGPGRLVMFILSDGVREIDPQKKNPRQEEIQQIAAQAKIAGVTIFAEALAPKGLSDELKILTSATGGRFWEAKSASDLALAVLNFYEQLAHPQETRIQGNNFRPTSGSSKRWWWRLVQSRGRE